MCVIVNFSSQRYISHCIRNLYQNWCMQKTSTSRYYCVLTIVPLNDIIDNNYLSRDYLLTSSNDCRCYVFLYYFYLNLPYLKPLALLVSFLVTDIWVQFICRGTISVWQKAIDNAICRIFIVTADLHWKSVIPQPLSDLTQPCWFSVASKKGIITNK